MRLGYDLTNLCTRLIENLEPIRISYIDLDRLLLQITSSKTIYEGHCDYNALWEDKVLDDVVHSYYYIARSTYVKQEWHICFAIKNIYKSARYYMFSSGSDDDYNISKIA